MYQKCLRSKQALQDADHFSLDSNDITHWLYSHWDVFKIWFVLQHYEKGV